MSSTYGRIQVPLALVVLVAMACGGRTPLGVGEPRADGAGPGGSSAGGASGQGGAGAQAGAPGTGGAGGAGGDPMTIVEACAVAATCAAQSDFPLFTASACVDGFALLGWAYAPPSALPDPLLAVRILDCAAKAAGDCDAFRSCYGGDWVSLSRCREGGACTGSVMQGYPGGAAFDCSAIGATCQDLWSGAIRACCNAVPCEQSTSVVCDGTVATYCGGWGEHVAFDCAPTGQSCVPTSEPWLGVCKGAEPCDSSAPTTCAGAVATFCSNGGLATYDCAKTSFRTRCAEGDPYERCVPKGDACLPMQGDLCEGDALAVCVDGVRVPVDCGALGFGGCGITQNGGRCLVP